MSASEQIEVFAALSGLSLEEALRTAKLIGTVYEPAPVPPSASTSRSRSASRGPSAT